MKQRLSLYELNSIVSEIISMSLPDSYWVEAELSEAREGYGGHCYLELIQKDERSNTPIAKAHANCWRNRWMLIKPNFERVTGQRIHTGMKVLLKVHAQFHETMVSLGLLMTLTPTIRWVIWRASGWKSSIR